MGRSDGGVEVLQECCLQVSISESHVAEAKCKINIFVKLYEIVDGQENSVQGISYNIFAEHCGSCNWYRICVDGSVALLENRVLAVGWVDFLFAIESLQVVL